MFQKISSGKGKSPAKESPHSTAARSTASPPSHTHEGVFAATPSTGSEPGKDPFEGFFSSEDEGPQNEGFPMRMDSLTAFLTDSDPSPVPESSSRPMEEGAEDEPYFNFFLSELSRCFPYVNLFPWTAAHLFSTSLHHPALRQSVLAVGALIADNTLGGHQSHEAALKHLQAALLQLQSQISERGADEGIAISSFLLAHFSIMLGDYKTAKSHLKGMVVVLGNLDPTLRARGTAVPSPLSVSGLTMLIWRMAKRIDFISSVACGRAPVLPRYYYQASQLI
jgi:Fungal specific transcription factor domain